jgi:hypothetical protein
MRLALLSGLAILMFRALGFPIKLPKRSDSDGDSELA